MGYMFYVADDGRDAGYGVAAYCDVDDCEKEINRGLDYRCSVCLGFFCYDHHDYCCSEHGWACSECVATDDGEIKHAPDRYENEFEDDEEEVAT